MIKAALDAFAASSKKEWAHDRTRSVGASAIGQCARQVWFDKNAKRAEIAPDPEYVDSYGAKIRGTVIEEAFWAPALKSIHGRNLLYAGKEQRTLILGELSCTPDGLLINQPSDALKHLNVADIEGGAIVLECKSIDSRFNAENLPKAANVYQAQVQMGMFRALTNHQPMYAVVSYIDAGWWDFCHEYVVKYDPAIFETARLRARDIMQAKSAQDLKPEGVIGGGSDCNYCAFTRACGTVRAAYVPREDKPVDATDTVRLANQAKLVAALEASAEQSAKDAREAKARLRDMLAEAGTRRVEGEGVKIRWGATRGRKSMDTKALREAAEAAGIDVSAFNKIGAEGDQLVISVSENP